MDQSNYMIRLAEPKDLPRIIEIWKEGAASAAGGMYLTEHASTYQRMIEERVCAPSEVNVCWVAERNDSCLVGWQSLTPRTNPINYFSIVESSTYTIRRSKCAQLGKRLILTAFDYAKKTSIEYIYGFTTTDNEASKQLMLSVGCQKVGEVPRSLKMLNRTQLEFWVYVVPADQS
jgi:L-amino acid N-acyltransferase YncA